MSLIPGGSKIKGYLNKRIFRKNLMLKNELEDKDMIVDNYQLTPITGDSPDTRHRYLYAIACARKLH